MENAKADVIIPSYRPGAGFKKLLERLMKQEYPINKIIVMNTEQEFWNREWEKQFPSLEVHHLKKEEFDHGGTRKKAAALSGAEILIFMTQDALPADRHLIGNLVRPLLEQENTGASYARQLPDKTCSFLERYTRSFNYPETPRLKTKEDLPALGIKTFFCSNVCAAYKRSVYEKLGGFVERTIFNEDMILASGMIRQGYGIFYAADAMVIHSHNYTGLQQFRRNFDLGVSQAEYPEAFRGVPSEGEGVRLVMKTLGYVLKKGRFWLVPSLIFQSGCKFAGYRAGKAYRRLPKKMVRWCTMNKEYWTEKNGNMFF